MNKLQLQNPLRVLTTLFVAVLLIVGVLLAVPSAVFFKAAAATSISGKVFRDFNGDGVQSTAAAPFETQGVAGVTVTVYNSSNAVVGTANTAADGSFSINDQTGTAATQYRVEFTAVPSYLRPGAIGANNNSTVQFITGGSSAVNLALQDPTEYSSTTTPPLVTTTYVNGDQLNAAAPQQTIASYNYNSNGKPGDAGYAAPTTLAGKAATGSIWGLAYARTSKNLYSAAFVKRHTGLYENPTGTTRPGMVFRSTNATTPASSATGEFFDVATISGVNVGAVESNATRLLTGIAPTVVNADSLVFGYIGKRGLGGLEISADESTLYTISLFDKKLIRIPIASPVGATATQIPEPTINACVNGVFRPFALKYYRNDIYIGGVCDATGANGTAANLKAVVLRADSTNLGGGFTEVYALPLNYTKGKAFLFGTCATIGNWGPWVDQQINGSTVLGQCTDANNGTHNIYPQPILSGITFDDTGAMILAFTDRTGHQTGGLNRLTNEINTSNEDGIIGGDLIRVCNVGGSFVTQGGTGCAIPADSNHQNNQGPGGGEFYWQDWLAGVHEETAQGGVTVLPGSGQTIATLMDPFLIRTAGVGVYSNTDGNAARGYEILSQNNTAQFSKAGGLGDIELLLDPAPIEIGNRVWVDSNGNGIQDAGEANLSGVQVQLWVETTPGSNVYTQVSTATTDANGNYLFSSRTSGTAGGAQYNVAQLTPGTRFQIRVPLNQSVITTPNYKVTGTNRDASANGTSRDSDAVLTGSGTTAYALVAGTLGAAGFNNHTYDIGFTNRTTAAGVSISGAVSFPKQSDRFSTTIINLRKENGETVTLHPDRKGQYSFDDLELGQVYVVTAQRPGYTFADNNRIIILQTAALDNVNFVGSPNANSSKISLR